MVKVVVGEKDKKKCQQAGVLRDYRKNSYFLKPSQKKRLKHEKAIRRFKKLVEKI